MSNPPLSDYLVLPIATFLAVLAISPLLMFCIVHMKQSIALILNVFSFSVFCRTRSGGYTCQAVNAVGKGRSQEMHLNVKCTFPNNHFRQRNSTLFLGLGFNLHGAYGLEKPQIPSNFRRGIRGSL